ncbi:MAG: Mov34/MPN/PAD-1 family protein [Planctomycetota bacterium]
MEIKVRGRRPLEPTRRPPPGIRPGTTLAPSRTASASELPVYVTQRALQGMVERGREGGDYEVGGFLLGAFCVHRGQPYVDVEIQVPAFKARSKRTSLAFDNDAQREFHETVDQRFPGQTVVGWYHTHPGYGVFLSGHDLFVHQSFYSAPYHVAVVVDPKAGPHERSGVFVWEDGQISSCYDLRVYT